LSLAAASVSPSIAVPAFLQVIITLPAREATQTRDQSDRAVMIMAIWLLGAEQLRNRPHRPGFHDHGHFSAYRTQKCPCSWKWRWWSSQIAMNTSGVAAGGSRARLIHPRDRARQGARIAQAPGAAVHGREKPVHGRVEQVGLLQVGRVARLRRDRP